MTAPPTLDRTQPVVLTPRLQLRPFHLDDAADVRRFAGDEAIADTALDVPHPFEEGVAEAWIATHEAGYASGELAIFAVTTIDTGRLVGAVGLVVELEHARAELGYWIARPHWGRGYATEAAAALLAFGFDQLGLRRIHATHLARNPASGRVLARIGMRLEGLLRAHVVHRGRAEDLAVYGLLAADRNPTPS